jgi:hypothetical protein
MVSLIYKARTTLPKYLKGLLSPYNLAEIHPFHSRLVHDMAEQEWQLRLWL